MEQFEKNLTPKTPEEELALLKKKVEENKSDLTIVKYLDELESNDLSILDRILNDKGYHFQNLNIFEGEEAKEVKTALMDVLKEANKEKKAQAIKNLIKLL